MKNNEKPRFFKKVGGKALTGLKAIPGVFLGKGTVKDLKNTKTFKFWTKAFWQKDNLKGVGKGLLMSAVTLAPAIAFGVVTAGMGFIVAPLIAYGISKVVRGTASLCGFKGFDKNADDRQKEKLDSISPKALQEKKEELKKQSKNKKIFAVCAVVLGGIVTALTGGAALPLLIGCCLTAGAAAYSARNDKKNATTLEGITYTSSKEQCGLAAVKLGMIKQKELDKIGVNIKEEKPVNKEKVNNEGEKLVDENRIVNMNDNSKKTQDKNQVKEVNKILDMNINLKSTSADKAKKIISNIKNAEIDHKKNLGKQPRTRSLV